MMGEALILVESSFEANLSLFKGISVTISASELTLKKITTTSNVSLIFYINDG